MAAKMTNEAAQTRKQLTYLASALKAPRITEAAARLADHARDVGWTHEEYLAAVLDREVAARNASGGQLRIRAAGFPARKTIEEFDWDAQPAAFRHYPGAPVLGVLGEQGVDATIARAAEHASAYDPYTDLSLVPTLEIITTIADRPAGDDGNYSAESKIENIRPYVDAAARAGQYVLLDLQPGRTDFLTQAKLYEELLLRPNVGLALDPEWRLKPHQVHLTQIGSVGADEVNTVVSWLADLTRDNNLPQKIMVLHSFRTSMLQEIERVDTSRPELAVTIHVDGQGAQGAKVNTWNTLLRYAPNIEHWGWKNFYDEDTPQMLTPEETMATVQPLPLLISYQ